MARRSAEAEENHWPGFVDALSTIVMVVTFLLIILAIAIFILSQSVAKTYIESQTQKTLQGGGDKQSAEVFDASSTQKGTVETEVVEGKSEAIVRSDDNARTEEKKSGGQSETPIESDFTLNLGGKLVQEKKSETENTLTVRSREVKAPEERVAVATDEVAQESVFSAEVKGSESLITLEFDNVTTRIDEASGKRVQEFLHDNIDNREGKIAVWSYAASDIGSISEAKRIAYYRALSARNELMKNGFSTEQIEVNVRVGETEEKKNLVRIVLLPDT